MADLKIKPHIRDILASSRIDGCNLYLPGTLDRETYVEVNKAITLLGGKWVGGKTKAHVFPSDPRSKFGAALESDVIVDVKKKLQAFFTPPELARRVVQRASVERKTVLEPSAGHGALAEACVEAGSFSVNCMEIDQENWSVLKSKRFPAVCGDFLKVDPDKSFFPDYDRVVMNPPFSRNQDIKHVNHALKFLKPGGRLVAIMSPNVSRDGFRQLVDEHQATYETIEAGAFKESGTNIETILVTIDV